MTPEKLKQRRRDRVRLARKKAAEEETAKWIRENFSEYGAPLLAPGLSPIAALSAVIVGLALAAGIAMLIEHGVI